MGKWLVLVGYEKMGNWLCSNKNLSCPICESMGNCSCQQKRFNDDIHYLKCSPQQPTQDGVEYNLLFICLHNKKNMSTQDFQNVFVDAKVGKDEDIIIFCHERNEKSGNPGSDGKTLDDLSKSYKNLGYRLFSAQYPCKPQNYPFCVITRLSSYEKCKARCQKYQGKVSLPSWEELKANSVDLAVELTHYKFLINSLFFDLAIQCDEGEIDNEKLKNQLEQCLETLKLVLKGAKKYEEANNLSKHREKLNDTISPQDFLDWLKELNDILDNIRIKVSEGKSNE